MVAHQNDTFLRFHFASARQRALRPVRTELGCSRTSARLGLTIVALASLPACAEVLDVPDEPRLVGPWSCLSATESPVASEPQPIAVERATAQVHIQACNFVSTNCGEHVTGLSAALCSKKDVNCNNPLVSGVHDVDGMLTIEVPTDNATGFDGFVSIAMPTAKCTDEKTFGPTARSLCSIASHCDPSSSATDCDVPIFAPALLFFNPPLKAEPPAPVPLPLVPTAAVQPLIEAAGGTFDPMTGYLFMGATDCAGQPASGVHYALSRDEGISTDLYLDDGVISNTSNVTDASGLGGFLGVPPGFISVSASVLSPQRETTTIGEVGVQVARFTITYATLTPQH